MQKNAIAILTVIFYVFIGAGLSYSEAARTITDRSDPYSPKSYANIDFVKKFNQAIPGLENLGEKIDQALLYSDVKMLTESAAVLGYCEKQWEVKSSGITADKLMDIAGQIADYRKSPDELKAVINTYNERSISVYNPEKAKKYETILQNLKTHPAGQNQCGTLFVRNNTGKNNILIYVNKIYFGTVRAGRSVKFSNIPTGKIDLSANDGKHRKWGPRKVYLSRNIIFRWELYL
ncbi:MAG: hypothetical protein K8T10_06525 [Candidatus Eremiobacteraeota bacterium]|nr:hypothetical protein [Candidatus Eremiobacteraeota bacterium]